MDTKTKSNFIKTSEIYLNITKSQADNSNVQEVASLLLLEKKMSKRFFQHSKSYLLDKIS